MNKLVQATKPTNRNKRAAMVRPIASETPYKKPEKKIKSLGQRGSQLNPSKRILPAEKRNTITTIKKAVLNERTPTVKEKKGAIIRGTEWLQRGVGKAGDAIQRGIQRSSQRLQRLVGTLSSTHQSPAPVVKKESLRNPQTKEQPLGKVEATKKKHVRLTMDVDNHSDMAANFSHNFAKNIAQINHKPKRIAKDDPSNKITEGQRQPVRPSLYQRIKEKFKQLLPRVRNTNNQSHVRDQGKLTANQAPSLVKNPTGSSQIRKTEKVVTSVPHVVQRTPSKEIKEKKEMAHPPRVKQVSPQPVRKSQREVKQSKPISATQRRVDNVVLATQKGIERVAVALQRGVQKVTTNIQIGIGKVGNALQNPRKQTEEGRKKEGFNQRVVNTSPAKSVEKVGQQVGKKPPSVKEQVKQVYKQTPQAKPLTYKPDRSVKEQVRDAFKKTSVGKGHQSAYEANPGKAETVAAQLSTKAAQSSRATATNQTKIKAPELGKVKESIGQIKQTNAKKVENKEGMSAIKDKKQLSHKEIIRERRIQRAANLPKEMKKSLGIGKGTQLKIGQ